MTAASISLRPMGREWPISRGDSKHGDHQGQTGYRFKKSESEWVIARARATSAGGHTRVCRRATTRRCSTRSSIVLISSSSTTTTLHYYAMSLSISFSPVDKGKPHEACTAPTLFFSSFGGCSARSQFDVTFCDTTRSAYRTPKLLIRIGVPRNGQR